MKIIKEGILDKRFAMRIECHCCDAELEIVAEDITKEYFVHCPCCEAVIRLYEGNIPHNMRLKIKLRETK